MVKNLPATARDSGSIPELRISPEGGNGNPLQYSCLENPMDRRAWQATVHGVTKELDTTWQLNSNHKPSYKWAPVIHAFFFFFLSFIYLRQVLVASHGIFVSSCGIFCCGHGLSCCRAWAPEREGSAAVGTGLVAPQHVGS